MVTNSKKANRLFHLNDSLFRKAHNKSWGWKLTVLDSDLVLYAVDEFVAEIAQNIDGIEVTLIEWEDNQ